MGQCLETGLVLIKMTIVIPQPLRKKIIPYFRSKSSIIFKIDVPLLSGRSPRSRSSSPNAIFHPVFVNIPGWAKLQLCIWSLTVSLNQACQHIQEVRVSRVNLLFYIRTFSQNPVFKVCRIFYILTQLN